MITIRSATPDDLAETAALAAKLVRFHHALDRLRFLTPTDRLEEGYRGFLATRLDHDDAVVMVADDDGAIVGYAYGALEDRDWNLLLEAHGAVHDVWVEERARRSGVARRLVEALCLRLEELGAPRIVLATATENHDAKRLFASMGFRETMLEMTREKKSGA